MAKMNNKSELKISADLSQLNNAMREAARSIQIANAQFKQATAGLDKWSDSASGVQAKLKQLNTTLEAENKKLDVLNDKYKLTVQNQGESAEQAQKLAVQIEKQKAKIAQTEANIVKYNNQLEEMNTESEQAETENKQLANSFDSVADNTERAGTKLEKFAEVLGKGVTGAAKIAGKAILAIGTASAAAGAAAVKSGADFDAQMSTVKAISQATEEEYEALRQKAIEMGSSTVFTAEESGQALEYMAMAGWKAEDMLDGLEGIINAAAASGEDLGKVSDIITDGLTAFGLQAKDSSHFADVLAQASANANTNIELMGESFKYVAPIAGSFKYSVDDIAVGIGLMANSGIKAEMAGTSLRAILTRLASPTKAVSGAMEELGLSLTDDEGNMKSFDTLLQDMQKSFKGLTETEKAHYASTIAGRPAMSGMLALVNATSTDYNTLADSIRNADGAAKEMADTRLDNLSGDVTLFKSALDAAKISLSDELSPALREIVQEGTAMLPELSGDVAELGGALADVVKGLMPIAKDTISAIVPLAREIMDVVKDILPYLSQMIQSLLPPAQKIIEAIIKVAKPFIENVLPPLTNLIDSLSRVLSKLLDVLTPIMEVISNIYSTMLGGFIDLWADVIDLLTGGEKVTEKYSAELSKLNTEAQKTVDRTKELKEEQDALNESMQNGFKKADGQQLVYDRLVERLKAVTDESGHVKKGQEELAKQIIGELNDALGTEMELVDGVIQKYQEEMDKIDELMLKKKAQAYADSAEDEYAEALQRQVEYEREYGEVVSKYNNAVDMRKQIESDMYTERAKVIEQGGVWDDRPWQESLDNINRSIQDLSYSKKQLEADMGDNSTIINGWEKLTEAIAENSKPKMEQAMRDITNNFHTAETASEDFLINQTATFRRMYETLRDESAKGGSKVTQQMVDDYLDMYYRSRAELAKMPGMTAEKIDDVLSTFAAADGDFARAGESNAANYENGLIDGLNRVYDTAVSTAQNIADSISQIISSASVNLNLNANVSTSPKTATGGIVTRAQTRIVGEDGAEAIVPLEKNTGWIDAVAQKVVNAMGAGSSGGNFGNTTYNFYQTNNSPKALSRLEIYRQSKNLLAFKR